MSWAGSLQNLHLLSRRLSAVGQYKMHCFDFWGIHHWKVDYRDIDTRAIRNALQHALQVTNNWQLQIFTVGPALVDDIIRVVTSYCCQVNTTVISIMWYIVLYEMKYYFVIVVIVVVLIATFLSVELVYVNNTRKKLGILWFVLQSVTRTAPIK